ncbi:MurR/RpiR family transcriptional regulator [Virgibacillus kimchii]
MSKQNVYALIAEKLPEMSKSQKKIAEYILENQHSVPFLTVGKLAKLTQVSQATVVRFATFLGYTGYNELQQFMYDSIEKQLNTVERLKMARSVHDTSSGIDEIFENDIANIRSTMENLNTEDFKKAANYLMDAETIYIVANRSAVSLGVFLHYYLEIIFGNAELVQSSESAFERMYNLNEKDVVIGISFARYTKSTVEIVTHAKEKGANVIAITDGLLSPVTRTATISLFTQSKVPSILDSFVAPLSLINTLINYIGKQMVDEIDERLEKLEQIWDRYDVFIHKKEQ